MNQNYIVDKLTLSDLTKSGKIVIPNFQRGIVWNKEHRKDFIETVKSGDPFGVVLVSQERPGAPYILIDGLQRLSTLKAYMSNPLEYVDENDKFIDKDKLQALFVKKYDLRRMQLPKEEKLEKEKKAFLKKMIAAMKASGGVPKATDLWRNTMADVLGTTSQSADYFDLFTLFDDFYVSFNDNLQLPDIIIHAIVYQGDQSRLPTVFENLNTTSVTLSKYEVFSSKWPSSTIIINDETIIQNVWSKYANLKKSSTFEVGTTEDTLRQNGVTLFEYCFAFSEILNQRGLPYSFMFSREKKSTDPTGFDILALACGLSVNKADDLWRPENLGESTGPFLIQLKDALIDATTFVALAIENWVTDLKGTVIKNTSLYQIYHMVITVFRHLYDFNAKEKRIQKRPEAETASWQQSFKKYAYKWYLFHHITGFWNQNRQVSDLKRLLDEENADFYVQNISRTQWENALPEFIETTKPTAITRTIDNDVKLTLNYLYKLLIKEDKNRENYFAKSDSQGNEIQFDIEHIVPVDKFKRFEEDLPMSTLGNLCYLPVKDNRSKRDKTIYEYALDRPSLTHNPDFLALIDYPDAQGLEFIDYAEEQFKESFAKFVSSREEKIKDKLIALLMQF